jgi:hypothetical protein
MGFAQIAGICTVNWLQHLSSTEVGLESIVSSSEVVQEASLIGPVK